MIAEIIAVGSELLTPFRQDTNSLFLTDRLNALGVPVAFKTIVGDNLPQLVDATRTALRRSDLVFFSGGLGPTEDDLTREAVAEVLQLTLHPDASVLRSIEDRFAARDLAMTPNNRKQADILATATMLPNSAGTAPGQILTTNTANGPRTLILLPGPPTELKTLFDEQCRSRLAGLLPEHHIAKRFLRILLVPESHADARVAPIYQQFPDVETTILAHSGEIQFHLASVKPTFDEAQLRVDQLAERIATEMRDDLISASGESPEEVVLSLLRDQRQTLAVAESCTGGLLSSRLTAVPHASDTFLGGAVVYTNQLKQSLTDVPEALLAQHGPVSPEVAEALAQGIRQRTSASVALSITGLAGPSGGSPGPDESKPIGLVYIALSTETSTTSTEIHLQGDRDRIRWWSTQHALKLLHHHLQKQP